MDAFDVSGVWWPAESPSARVAGTLHFSEEKDLSLSLLGSFGPVSYPLGPKKHHIILGLAYDSPLGNRVTLKDSWQSGATVGISEFNKETYHVERAFFGANLKEEADFLFPNCTLQLSGLSAWAAHLSGFHLTHEETPGKFGFSLTYKPPAPLVAPTPDGQVILGWGASSSRELRQQTFREEVSFNVESERFLSEDEWGKRYVGPLQNLLTLATGAPNAIGKLSLHRWPSNPGDRQSYASVQIIAAPIYQEPKEGGGFGGPKMLFTLEDVEGRFGALIKRWLEIHDTFVGACNVFFGIQYAPQTFLDTTLLAVMQSLELYQAKRKGRGAEPKATIPPEVLASLPADVKLQLQECLQGPMAFGTTLLELFNEHRSVIAPLSHLGMAGLVEEVMQLRGQVLHWKEADQLPNYGYRLHLVTETLKILMKACLLAELGFTEEERGKLFNRNLAYGSIRHELTRQA